MLVPNIIENHCITVPLLSGLYGGSINKLLGKVEIPSIK